MTATDQTPSDRRGFLLPSQVLASSYDSGDKPPAWLRVAAVTREIELQSKGVQLDGSQMVLALLADHGEERDVEYRICSRCHQHQAPPAPVQQFLFRVSREVGLIGSLCVGCAEAEGGANV